MQLENWSITMLLNHGEIPRKCKLCYKIKGCTLFNAICMNSYNQTNTLQVVHDDFKLCSSGTKINCTLWGEFCDALEKYLAETSNSSIILVLQLARTKRFSGQRSLHKSELYEFAPSVCN